MEALHTSVEANIIDFPQQRTEEVAPAHNGVERYNGLRINLGKMHLGQLTVLEVYARERIAEAQADLLLVEYYRERLTSTDDPGAA